MIEDRSKPEPKPAPDAISAALDGCCPAGAKSCGACVYGVRDDAIRETVGPCNLKNAARAAHAAELARAEAQRVALEAADRLAGAVGRLTCDNYRELLAAHGHYAHLVLNPLWDAYRAARTKAGA